MEKKKLEEVRRILIVVDMVNGFVKEGPLADKSTMRIIPEAIRLVEDFLEEHDPVIAFRDAHTPNAVEFKRYPVHCVDGTYESELIDELKIYEQYLKIFKKNSTSGFVLPEYREYIDQFTDLKEIITIGVCSDICDLNLVIPQKNYFDQYDRDVNIIVPKNAIDTYNAPWHNRDEYNEMAFKLMNQAGIKTPEVYRKVMR